MEGANGLHREKVDQGHAVFKLTTTLAGRTGEAPKGEPQSDRRVVPCTRGARASIASGLAHRRRTLRSDALAYGNEMFKDGVVAPEGKLDALLGQLGDLGIGVPRSGPALDIGGLGPPAVAFVVVDDAYGFHSILHVRVASVRLP